MYKPFKKEIVSLFVQNRANTLSRIANMFGRRGFNIENITASPTSDPALTRITIVFSATEQSMQQIITQTEKLECVEKIFLLNRENAIYRELLLVKVNVTEQAERSAIKEIVDIFRGRILDLSTDSMIVELTGSPEKVDGFLDVIYEHDVAEICRTGVAGLESNVRNAKKTV
ncbi:MAG: acetolactate synthase small subunit [Eubacterium sp.]|nr:acetolactate synthase small subunit [Eubacterium sp.]